MITLKPVQADLRASEVTSEKKCTLLILLMSSCGPYRDILAACNWYLETSNRVLSGLT